VVETLPTSNFIEMRRMAHDETPFLLAMQPRVTTLAWSPTASSVILLGTHGPNRLAHDETPYPLTRTCFIIFMGPSCFLLRILLLLSRGSLGKAYQGLFLGFYLFPACFYLLGLYPLLPTRQGETLK
jgi:hypothetical protein